MLDPTDFVSSPTGTAAEQSGQRLAEDLNQFLNLLVTQLENQDPLDPLDPNEFTSQLVQFASVEQQIHANENLEDMLELQQASLLGTVVSYIGSQVEVSGDQLPLENGQASFTYDLDARATSNTITISDEDGQVVFFTAGENDPGQHSFTWNGTDNFGFPLEDGVYTLNVNALDAEGLPIDVAKTVIGTVDGVSMEDGEALLSVGGAEYSVDQILSVRRPQEAEAVN